MTDTKAICEQIVEAASLRFHHYGYGKTTMAEIASDCNMSPGNLYRYFPSKLDIAEQIAERGSDEKIDEARKIVRDPNLAPVEKLRAFLFNTLDSTFAMLAKDPKIHEIAQIISSERPEFSNRQLAKERSLLTEILSAGNASGDFDIDDINYTAEMIQSATMKYKYPQLFSKLTIEKLRAELHGVLDLILNGLSNKGAHRADTAA